MSFDLNEEIRDGWLVTREQKKIWDVELRMAKELLRVCEEEKIPIYASFGTVLGAVRHHGFIPWDKDMDFFIFREDYERFITLGDRFNKPYFLQTVQTEGGKWFRPMSRVVDCSTTCLTPRDKNNLKSHNGIFIDIFPMDKVPDPLNKKEVYAYGNKLDFLRSMCNLKVYGLYQRNEKGLKRALLQLARIPLSFVSIQYLNNQLQKACQAYKDSNFEGYRTSADRYLRRTKRHYALMKNELVPAIDCQFEYLTLKIPGNYHAYLSKIYGENYMEFPPEDKRNTHGRDIINPDISYVDYANKNEGKS